MSATSVGRWSFVRGWWGKTDHEKKFPSLFHLLFLTFFFLFFPFLLFSSSFFLLFFFKESMNLRFFSCACCKRKRSRRRPRPRPRPPNFFFLINYAQPTNFKNKRGMWSVVCRFFFTLWRSGRVHQYFCMHQLMPQVMMYPAAVGRRHIR